MSGYVMLQQAINYIEEHLLTELNHETVARQVHMSSYEFHRAFSFMADMTVNTYIRNRRLSLAGQEMLKPRVKVTDVALKYGYDTPESFTKAFTRFHGIAPSCAKNVGVQLTMFDPLVVKIIMEGGTIMNYRMEEVKGFRLLALVRTFQNDIVNEPDNHDIPDFWKECHDKKLVEPIRNLRPEGKRDLYGLCTPKGENSFEYGIGIVIDDDTFPFDEEEMQNMGYRFWEVEDHDYVVFDCMGEDGDCIGEAWSRFYKEFLPQTGYEAAEVTDYEIYYEKGKPGMMCELWIPIDKNGICK